MTRLEKALEVFKEDQTKRIVRQLCPTYIAKELPDCDKNTFTRYTNLQMEQVVEELHVRNVGIKNWRNSKC